MSLRTKIALSICSCIFLTSSAVAVDNTGEIAVDADTAVRVARHHLAYVPHTGEHSIIAVTPVWNDKTNRLQAWKIDLQPAGYIIISGSKDIPPVIAYSFTSNAGSFSQSTNPLANLLRADLHLRNLHADKIHATTKESYHNVWSRMTNTSPSGSSKETFQQWPASGTTPTGGWLQENWHQDAPYDALCPMDQTTHQRSDAGCPAVAMAMILDYHKRINGKVFNDADDYYHNYGGNRYWIDDDYISFDFPSFPQLNDYLDETFKSYFSGSPVSNYNRAALVFACGVAARQVYTSSGSGTFSVSQAMEAYQEFNCDTAELLDDSSTDIYTRLADNMINAFPAHLAIVNSTWTAGHNVVVDGYNTDNYFHINFGWGGLYNGWYRLPSELPYNLTVLEGLIVDIMIEPCDSMDGNCDGVVDLKDYSLFASCLTGPEIAPAAPGCSAFDADSDTDVDLQDFAVFQKMFSNE